MRIMGFLRFRGGGYGWTHYEGEEAEIRQLTFRYVSCLIPWVRTGLDALRKVVKTNT